MFRVLRQRYIPIRARDALLGHQWRKMYSSSTVKDTSSSTVKDTSSSGTESKVLWFKNTISKFNHVEESGLRIRIIGKDSFSDAMGIGQATEPPPSSLTDLYLDKFGFSQIIAFDPDDYPELNEAVSSFLFKLCAVAEIQAQDEFRHEETYTDNMAVDLMKAAKHDDGKHLNMLRRNLKFSVGEEIYSVRADRAGTRGKRIVWVMQEIKHLGGREYKHGDVELALCMIAAYQANLFYAKQIYPEKMMAIKIVGDKFFFYSMEMTIPYMKDLEIGGPDSEIEVFKYPSEKDDMSKRHRARGLRITVPEERKQILDHLWSMRCYAAGLDRIKGRC